MTGAVVGALGPPSYSLSDHELAVVGGTLFAYGGSVQHPGLEEFDVTTRALLGELQDEHYYSDNPWPILATGNYLVIVPTFPQARTITVVKVNLS
ncbi:MAG TPA: hypothetical protein VFN61_12495 [Acidimicrobiales bacterium]|nr:hypothetical protein [Acidimicrobiales bacterium]